MQCVPLQNACIHFRVNGTTDLITACMAATARGQRRRVCLFSMATVAFTMTTSSQLLKWCMILYEMWVISLHVLVLKRSIQASISGLFSSSSSPGASATNWIADELNNYLISSVKCEVSKASTSPVGAAQCLKSCRFKSSFKSYVCIKQQNLTLVTLINYGCLHHGCKQWHWYLIYQINLVWSFFCPVTSAICFHSQTKCFFFFFFGGCFLYCFVHGNPKISS